MKSGDKKLYHAPNGKRKISLRGQSPGFVPKFRLPVRALFTRPGAMPALLLPVHALILNYDLAMLEPDDNRFDHQFKTTKHLFDVVRNDTNLDKILDKDDRIDLLASDIDGTNLITIANDVQVYRVVDNNQLMITRNLETGTEISVYDLTTGENKVLDIEIPAL